MLVASQLDHLRRMTDPRGLMHAAIDDCPNRSRGYESIDQADALRLCAMGSDTVLGDTLGPLAGTYLDYLNRARTGSGRIHHACDAGGVWMDDRDDAMVQARLARALAAVIVSELPIRLRLQAAAWWTQLLACADSPQSPSSAGHWLIALGTLRLADPGRDVDRAIKLASYLVEDCYYACRTTGWEWFEPQWTQGAACIPAGLWLAYRMTDERRLGNVARMTTGFVLEHMFENGVCVPVGTVGGWYRDRSKGRFDQKPGEAASLVELFHIADTVSDAGNYDAPAAQAGAWFAGCNISQTPLVNERTGACSDALRPTGADRNFGATATVAYLLSRAHLSAPARAEIDHLAHMVIG